MSSTYAARPVRWARSAARDTATMLWRDLIRTARQPATLMFAVVMGVFFLVLFNYVFGGAIGGGARIDYLQFLVPGVLVITALQGAQQTSMSFAADLAEGVTDRFKSLPINQFSVIAGRTVADAVRNVIGLALVVVLAVVMGYRFGSWWGALAAVAVTTAVGFAFSWLGAAIAAKVRQPDAVGMLSMFWLFPLMLASSAFTPVETMPGWLRPLVQYQPISVASDTVRDLSEGVVSAAGLWITAAWVLGLLAIFIPLSVRLYAESTA